MLPLDERLLLTHKDWHEGQRLLSILRSSHPLGVMLLLSFSLHVFIDLEHALDVAKPAAIVFLLLEIFDPFVDLLQDSAFFAKR